MASTGRTLEAFDSLSSPYGGSFSELLAGAGDVDGDNRSRLGAMRPAGGIGIPKFKSTPPPSLPTSPPPMSPSAFFDIPAGLSPSEFLDSPLLLSASNILPSPTTGTLQSFNWRFPSANHHQRNKDGSRTHSDFTFQTSTKSALFQSSSSHVSGAPASMKGAPNYHGNNFELSAQRSAVKVEAVAPNRTSSSEIPTLQPNYHGDNSGGLTSDHGRSNQLPIQTQSRRSDDGYNWRKYGQKQVKGSENPRSYYKCTYASCPAKKKVETSLDGQITEIVYKGEHSHPKPQATKRNQYSSSQSGQGLLCSDVTSDHSQGGRSGMPVDSVSTPDYSSGSFGAEDDANMSSQRGNPVGDNFDDEGEEPESKRLKKEGENDGHGAPGNRTVREPRVVVQTPSEIDILPDGYRWRKYGQKVVKGNPNPRSYYKCTTAGCPVRKHIERASTDRRSVITTYEGKHNHDVPAERGSSISRAQPEGNDAPMARHPGMASFAADGRLGAMGNQAPSVADIFGSSGSFGAPHGYQNSQNFSANQYQQQHTGYAENMFPATKDEPGDDLFLESLMF